MPSILLARARRPSRATICRLASIAVAFGAVACGDAHVTVPHARGEIAIASGNAQRGAPGERLDRPIVIVVRDALGAPASGIRVTWIAGDGGAIEPAESVTDENGRTAATWTLGAAAPQHRGRALAVGYVAVEFTASTDGELPFDVIQPLALTTYDGSGQTVHPDYVATSPEWTRASQYLFITPYPNGNARFENPSIFARNDPLQWSVPTGTTNPILTPRDGYYSDPDALYVAERNELWLYFRQVTDQNIIRLTTSRDGVHWTAPVIVAQAPNHQIISPTVAHRAPSEWLMWAVNGNDGCTGASATVELRRSNDGSAWSKAETVELSQPGLFPWHIDVEWIPSRGEFWALFNAKTSGSCTTGAVYLATSSDGLHWKTYPSPVLAHGAIPELQDVVYRSTFAYDPASDALTIWYSGARYDQGTYVWRSAVQRRLRADLFAAISGPMKDRAAATPSVPPLRDFP
jgi:hypothetical protein